MCDFLSLYSLYSRGMKARRVEVVVVGRRRGMMVRWFVWPSLKTRACVRARAAFKPKRTKEPFKRMCVCVCMHDDNDIGANGQCCGDDDGDDDDTAMTMAVLLLMIMMTGSFWFVFVATAPMQARPKKSLLYALCLHAW